MVFSLFSRKSTLDDSEIKTNDTRLPTPTPSVASVAHQSPLRIPAVLRTVLGGSTTVDSDLATESVAGGVGNDLSPAPPPPITPSPPPADPNETKALYDLMLTIPPKTLHAYTLAHLRPHPLPSTAVASPALGLHLTNTPRPPSPNTIAKLTTFFSTLAPPPLLHCIRCHKDFYDIENEGKDKACRVPHDDESALVSRVSGGGYETLWGCCGQTASGDGSEGPPDGWCYEGRHTTDIKRARFRADSTIHDDKLTSCLKLNCHGTRDRLPRPDAHASPSGHAGTSSARKSNPSPARSQGSALVPRSARKRPRKSLKEASGSENEADAESVVSVTKAKGKGKVGGEDTSMAVDESSPPKFKAKTDSRPIKSLPISRRPPASTSTTASPTARPEMALKLSARVRMAGAKPKSASRTLLSQSRTHAASDSEASTRSRPRTRSHVREESRVRDASQGRPTSKLTRADTSERPRRTRKVTQAQPPTSEEEQEAETEEQQESDQERRGRDRKKRRVGRG